MKLAIIIAALSALVLAPAAAEARAAATPRLAVGGAATLQRPAEWVRVSLYVRAEGVNQLEALRALDAARERIEGGLRRLRGLERAAFTAEGLNMDEVRGPDCPQDQRIYLAVGPCAAIGAVGTLKLEITFAPAERTGDVASLATQLGGLDVRIEAAGVDDPEAFYREALNAAARDARRQAEALAAATGVRLGPALSVQDGRSRFAVSEQLELTATLSVDTLANEIPEVNLELTPPPVSVSTSVSIEYGLLP